jgi:hypothetical protein
VYPSSKLIGCYFHFVKAIGKWLKQHLVKEKDHYLNEIREISNTIDEDPSPKLNSKKFQYFITTIIILQQLLTIIM